MTGKDQGASASPTGPAPFGLSPASGSQAEPLVPSAGHTPGPWTCNQDTGIEYYRGPDDAPQSWAIDGPEPEAFTLAVLVTDVFGEAEIAANAAFIVRACNSHYELLEALQQMVADHRAIQCKPWPSFEGALTAIAKATGA